MGLTKSSIVKSLVLSSALLVLSACGAGNDSGSGQDAGGNTSDSNELIEITFPTYKAGQNVGAKLFLGQVERFNEEYEGQYAINVEEIPQDAYGQQIQQLAQQDELPVIVHAPGSGSLDPQWFENVVIENNLYYDLSGWYEGNEMAQEVLIEEFVEFGTTEDGELVSMPDYRVRSPFLYYNETMYSPEQNIREMTLEEFSQSLGDNKIAFMTGENAWTTGLLWTAIIANEPGGAELLQNSNAGQLVDINDPIIVESVEKLKTFIEDHGADNTLGAIFADAANAFMSKNAAVIANGPWMTADFEEESSDKWSNGFQGSDVRGDYFPGNIGIQNYEAYGDWVSASASDEEKELAEAWFSFLLTPEEMEIALLTEGGQTPNYEPSEEYLEQIQEDQVLNDIQNATTDDLTFVPNILDLLPNSVADTELSKFLPPLLNGDLTPEEFCEELTLKAQQAAG